MKEIINAGWMYAFVAVIIIGILVQNFIMMRKAWNHAKNDLKLDNTQIRKGLINGILVSIVPTIPVIVVLLTMVPMLGSPLPWLRLSVIGSATGESIAADAGLQSVGETLGIGTITMVGWTAACWVMSLGNSSSLLWSTFAIRPISKMYDAAEKVDMRLVLGIGAGCLAGTMAYAAVNFGLKYIPSGMTTFWAFAASFCLGIVITLVNKKLKKSWLNDFLMAICMLFGMFIACVV